MDLGILPDSIPMQRKTTRGRPRIYPRIDDVLRYKRSLEITTSGIEDSKVEVQSKKSQNQIDTMNEELGSTSTSITTDPSTSKLRQILTNNKETFKDGI